ncbi:MAG TPA: cation-translocating P-type ATPase, partial [Bacteroidetes bacterium]|nr:cation-translocating P-type ATPase [Bacteroidota bacterium]
MPETVEPNARDGREETPAPGSAGVVELEIPVVGMTCANCARTVERTLERKVPGVVEATVNYGTESATVAYEPAQVDLEAMAEAVAAAGYRLVLPAAGEELEDAVARERASELAAQERAFTVGVIFTLPLFLLSMGRDAGLLGGWAHAFWVNLLF